MGTYTFKPAVRGESNLIIGLIGPSGSGKTYSALRMASGIVGNGGKIAFIDTENGRGLHYDVDFKYDYCALNEPFTPMAYAEAVIAADKAGYKVIIVDSMSHVWAGEGGVSDWHDNELDRLVPDKNDWKQREKMTMLAWKAPKVAHKKMVLQLLRIKANLILCFRAEEKIKMVKDDRGKAAIVPVGFQPICDKNMPYELTVSALMTADNPGIPSFLKLQEQHKKLFSIGHKIDESAGRAISEWAKGRLSESVKTLCDCRNRIAACQTVEELKALGTFLTAAKPRLNATDLSTMHQLWGGRAEELKATHQATIPEPTTEEEPFQGEN